MRKLLKKIKRAFGGELDVRAYTPDLYHAHYEYYTWPDGSFLIRIYRNSDGKCLEQIPGKVGNNAQMARKYAQKIIKQRMNDYRIIPSAKVTNNG